MAYHYKGKARGNRGAGYAAAGHAAKSGFNRHADRGYRFAVTQLCCADGTGVHPAAAGGGHCGGKGAGRAFWKAADAAAGKFSTRAAALGTRRNLRKAGRSAIKNHPQDVPPVGERKSGYISAVC